MIAAGLPVGARGLRLAQLLRWLLVAGWIAFWLAVAMGAWRVRPSAALWWPIGLSVLAVGALGVWIQLARERLVREAPLPHFLGRKLREHYPHLSAKDAELVERGLRQFFFACARSRRRFVAMPSKAVDAMWHEFILHTRAYRQWCELVLGRFLHHTPAEALGARADRNDGLRRAWFWACKDEAIDPRTPTRLPLLFALDAKLGIEGGFRYEPDCGGVTRTDNQGTVHCGASMGNDSFSGDADGFGGSDGGGSDGDGGDGGCGGD